MTEATMSLLRSAAACAPWLALLALSTAHPSPASAQTTTTPTTSSNQAIDSNLVVRRNGKIVPNGTLVYANVADCGGETFPANVATTTVPTTFEFSVTYTTNVPIVELWLGVGSSEVCSTTANRLRPANNASLAPICTFLGTDTSNTRNPKISITGNQLFNQTTGYANPPDLQDPSVVNRVTKTDKCDAVNGGQTYTIYMLPLQTPTTNVNGSDPITVGVLSTLKAVFTPYTQRPDPPGNLSGQSGESEIGISFKAPSSSMTLTQYKAYFDITGGGGVVAPPVTTRDAGMDAGIDAGITVSDAGLDGALPDDQPDENGDLNEDTDDAGTGAVACGSGILVAEQLPPANPSAAQIRSTSAAKTTTLKLSDLSGVPVGTNIAAAVVSIDPAGNESNLSAPICVERVNTTGFLDACDNTPGCRKGFDSCSLSPAQSGSVWSFSLFSLALAALIRRRKRALSRPGVEARPRARERSEEGRA